ncbi:MAG TPA: MATE family efflux transporter [Tepidisphaeraceae bacterium]|jgi:putative MATE family efflux protein|nr:MATE family efflux transporter [Tepidisphaeraceae bacterium]
MSDVVAYQPPLLAQAEKEDNALLLRQLIWLSVPVLAENVLHLFVGLTDTYLANHLPDTPNLRPAAASAVGTISYLLWFIGLIVGAIATGSTALIARAVGARHRSLANSVCGQSVLLAILLGVVLGILLYLGADQLVIATRLQGPAKHFARSYARMLSISLPFNTLMLVANACLRGAGDTLSPALSMIAVDVINMFFSASLTYGWFGMPRMGFEGIALGTVIAYIAGGVIQFVVLEIGRGGIRLHRHRMRPHWHTIKRILKIGVPSGMEWVLTWVANFAMIIILNQIDPTNAMPAAHHNAVRLEAMSYLSGFAIATAAATLVGQSLGMRNPRRATRSAYLAYALGGGIMTFFGIIFIFFGRYLANWMSADAHIAELTARCLFITGFIQSFFAAAIVFGGALRGAGDTFAVMIINLASIILIRFLGVMIVGFYLRLGLGAIWVVLCTDLLCRGVMMYLRFLHGGWRHVEV